jgi:hypothetical protein
LDKNHRLVSTPHGFAITKRTIEGWEQIRWYGSIGEAGEGYLRLSTSRSRLTLPQAAMTAEDRLDRASARFKAATKAYLEATNGS